MENLESILSAFDATLDKTISNTWAKEEDSVYLMSLVEGNQIIVLEANKVGDFAFNYLEENAVKEDTEAIKAYIVNFLWARQLKAFLILWRDVLFQHQKAQILQQSGTSTAAVSSQLKEESRLIVLKAAEELKQFVTQELKTIRTSRLGTKRQISRWQKQHNPWPTYKKQLTELPEQCLYLQKQYHTLEKTEEGFQHIKKRAHQMVEGRKQEFVEIQKRASDTIQYIKSTIEDTDEPKLGKVATRLEDLQADINISPDLYAFPDQLNQHTKVLPEKVQVPVETQEGIIHFKEVNFQRNVKQWLDSEVLPIYYELAELTEGLFNGVKMSLVNIRNRVLLLAAEIKEGKTSNLSTETICQPLYSFLKKTEDTRENLEELSDLIISRLDAEFQISAIYYRPTDTFLPVPIQSALNNLRFNQNQLLTSVQEWWNNQAGLIQNFRQTVEEEERLSLSEKIVRFIRHSQGDQHNNHYTSIFLTKGFIGESFWVGRERELQHIESLITNWRNGYRGAVVLTGQRLSGKSLFGELVASRHFGNEAIRLMPASPVQVGGRRLNVEYNLETALDFIRKHTLNGRPLVWIDDFELWRDPNTPISQNLRILRKYIDNYSGRMFFMVSMGNWLHHHLQRFHEMDRLFQAEINLDKMPLHKIEEAILIRHGATHKALVDEKGKEIQPKQFRKMTTRVYRSADGNIGEALNRWAASIYRMDEDRVFQQYKTGVGLPDFLNPESALVLSAIMMAKRTNEYRLRKLFGPAFADKYSGVLQRLISVGLLTRHLDGWLEISEVAANEMGKQLDRNKYLKFYAN